MAARTGAHARFGCYISNVKRKRPLADSSDAPAIPAGAPKEVPSPSTGVMASKNIKADGVDPELLEGAKRAIEVDRLPKPARCTVCSEDCAPISSEGLCWVCRRLKLSAWRDSDMQMPAQE